MMLDGRPSRHYRLRRCATMIVKYRVVVPEVFVPVMVIHLFNVNALPPKDGWALSDLTVSYSFACSTP
jgi:hypothetical protein